MRLRPDLILMDVRMPGIGGIAAAARITSQAVPAPVVILVTGADLPIEVPKSMAARIVAKDRLTRAGLKRVWEDHRAEVGSGGTTRARNPDQLSPSPPTEAAS